MGSHKSPQEAQLLQQEIVRRQARDDSMIGKNFTTAVQKMQLGQGMQKQMGDQFVSNYRSQTPYYFSDAEARQDINAAASQVGCYLRQKNKWTKLLRVLELLTPRRFRLQREIDEG